MALADALSRYASQAHRFGRIRAASVDDPQEAR